MRKILNLLFALSAVCATTAFVPPLARAATVTVTIDNYTFKPAKLVIHPGDAVVWRNQDSMPHTASALDGASFDTGAIDPGASSNPVVLKAGEYAYHCAIHPDMRGTVDVH
jgi:plastocyanin